MGVERFRRELASHFVLESPCPPDNTVGVGRFDSTAAEPAGIQVLRESAPPRTYAFPRAGSSSSAIATYNSPFLDSRPHSARRIFASSLAQDFHVHENPVYKPLFKVRECRTASQLGTSSLAPSVDDPPQRRRMIQLPVDNLRISHEEPSVPPERPHCRRLLAPKVDLLDGTELQPVPTLDQKTALTYPFGHRHGKKHFRVTDSLFHDEVPLPPNVMKLPVHPAPARPNIPRGVSPYRQVTNLNLAWQ